MSNLSQTTSAPTCASKGTVDYTGSYDSWGNTTSQVRGGITRTLSYDGLDHLVHWNSSVNSQEEWNLYDASGERVLRRTYDGTNTVLTVFAFGDEKGNWYRVKMEEQELRDVAIAEILYPTFALTRQFLAMNQIVFKENIPFLEDIILKEEENIAEVYFPVEEERYYFVVYIDVKPQVSIRWMGMSAGNRVYFLATSEEHDLDELITLINIEPTRTWKKGKNIKHNGFEIQASIKETGTIEDKLHTLIGLLLPHKADLQTLSTIANLGIQIAYWGYKEQMGGMHFEAETLQKLGALNLSIDIDLYVGGLDLGES